MLKYFQFNFIYYYYNNKFSTLGADNMKKIKWQYDYKEEKKIDIRIYNEKCYGFINS